jgi:ketosteroid isomerase-like protein
MEVNDFLKHREEDTPNIRLVKDLYRAMAEGDIPGVHRILCDTPEWHVCPGNPEGGSYRGMDEIFGTFYRKLLKQLHGHVLIAEQDVFIDGGDVVTVLGFYGFKVREDSPYRRVRFSHTWKISPEHRIEGVWQVCDSYEKRRYFETD